MPWRGVWPGALFVTLTTGVANAVYPFYLANVSSIGDLGGAIGFILIALVWFYLVSLSLHGGRGDQRAALRAPRDRARCACRTAHSEPATPDYPYRPPVISRSFGRSWVA